MHRFHGHCDRYRLHNYSQVAHPPHKRHFGWLTFCSRQTNTGRSVGCVQCRRHARGHIPILNDTCTHRIHFSTHHFSSLYTANAPLRALYWPMLCCVRDKIRNADLKMRPNFNMQYTHLFYVPVVASLCVTHTYIDNINNTRTTTMHCIHTQTIGQRTKSARVVLFGWPHAPPDEIF